MATPANEAAVAALPTLDDFLLQQLPGDSSASLREVVQVLAEAGRQVTHILTHSLVHHVGSTNVFGDAQLSVDVQADARIFKLLRESPVVYGASSEEEPELQTYQDDEQTDRRREFIVCFDPLDGSSIVDCNWAVGTIFGVWPKGPTGTLIGRTSREQVVAAAVVYGPRTTAVFAVPRKEGEGKHVTFELTLVNDCWRVTCPELGPIANVAKIFAPANLRAAQELPWYNETIQRWMQRKLTLRYTGGLVPDVYQLFVKGSGVFCSPASDKSPAKLRLTFECGPMALLVECAGGLSSNFQGQSVLDVVITSMDQRTSFCVGSQDEVVPVHSACV